MNPLHCCYLVATIDTATMQITHVGTYSEPAWGLTKLGRGYALANLLEVTEDSYQRALDLMREVYPSFLPEMAARFPLPEPDNTPHTVEAIS